MNQSYGLYKKNPNKRAHDLNEEIKKNTQTATTGFFFYQLLCQFFNFLSMILFLFFMPEEEKAKQN